MAYSLSPWLKPRFFITGTNRPLAGGLMYTYKAGTTDPAKTYSDDTGTENTNPIQLDSDGQCDLFLDDAVSYRIILKNSAGVTQFDKDRIASIGSTQVQSFNSIAALRLRSGTTIANAAKTLGYYAAGDGGGNSFYWDGTSTATDNAGTVIKPTAVSGAGRWLAVNSAIVTDAQFGVLRSAVTSDHIFIQSAIDSFGAAGGVIKITGDCYLNQRLILKDNITIEGGGVGAFKPCTVWATPLNYQMLTALRDDAGATPHKNIRIQNLKVTGKLNGAVPSHANDSSVIELEYCDNCIVDNVEVLASNDSCIRISGYKKGIVSFESILTNPDFGFSHNNTVSNCRVSGGYIGIELVGGARCNVLNSEVLDSYVHGIRLAGGGWDSVVSNNRVVSCANGGGFGVGLYIDCVKNLVVDCNNIDVLPNGNAAISFGLGQNVTVTNNMCMNLSITDSVIGSVTRFITGLIIGANTVVSGDLYMYFATRSKIFDNWVSGAIRAKYISHVKDNYSTGLVVDSPTDIVQKGGSVWYESNKNITTGKNLLPTVQSGIVGKSTAAPTSGDWAVGDIVYNSSVVVGMPQGWTCKTAGTPGTWIPFYALSNNARVVVEIDNNGISTAAKQLITFTVPNADLFVAVDVFCVMTRAPSSSAGTSRIIKKTFAIGRVSNADVVLSTLSSAGEYEIVSTSAGGANNALAGNIAIARAGAESSTSSQTVKITGDFTSGSTFTIRGRAEFVGVGVDSIIFT